MVSNGQRVGLHVSAAGGVENAPDRAKEFGAECFQFFSRSPRGGAAPEITDDQAAEFQRLNAEYGFDAYIHAPYYINFASKEKRIRESAPRIIREELERASKLGVAYVVVHPGSAKDYVSGKKAESPREALDVTVEGLKQIYSGGADFSARLLLEISAGAGAVIGNSFEDLAYLLDGLGRSDVHVCFDTCHAFASGYDLRTGDAIDDTMERFQKIVGLSQLKLVHMNDSKADLDERTDRHEHIGKGHIGDAGFKSLLAHKDFRDVNFILETKHDEHIDDDIAFLKKYRSIT